MAYTSRRTATSTGYQKASFWRGGTSNGVVIAGQDLPQWPSIRERYLDGEKSAADCAEILHPLYQAMMGSPDPYGRQLNGMGGGISSLSKAVIVDRSVDPQCDLDYLFIQIGIKSGKLDLAGNCGNMTSTVAPFGLDNGLVTTHDAARFKDLEQHTIQSAEIGMEETALRVNRGTLSVKLRNLNTSRIIIADIHASSLQGSPWEFEEQGDYVLEGVSGYASPITLSFLSPGGAKTGRALPTGNPVDHLEYSSGQKIRASLLDISNPGVFIDGRDVGLDPTATPDQLNANTSLMAKLESIRQAGATAMGLNPNTSSIPKVVLLFPPQTTEVDITCQALSMEQAHKAVPMTLGLNLGVACKLSGTIPNQLARHRDKVRTVLGHPSGKVEVGADISPDGEILSAKVIRTARCLMQGYVNAKESDRPITSSSG